MPSARSTALLWMQCINSSWSYGAARDISNATRRRVSTKPQRRTRLILVSPAISDLCYLYFLSGGKERNYFSEYRYFLLFFHPTTAQLITFTNMADGIHVTVLALGGYSLPSEPSVMFLPTRLRKSRKGKTVTLCWIWTSSSWFLTVVIEAIFSMQKPKRPICQPAFQLLPFPVCNEA